MPGPIPVECIAEHCVARLAPVYSRVSGGVTDYPAFNTFCWVRRVPTTSNRAQSCSKNSQHSG